jgi:ribonucleoside-triphosphate reductase
MSCKCRTEVYARVVGFYRPIQEWNKGKKAEFFNRKTYKVDLSAFESRVQSPESGVYAATQAPSPKTQDPGTGGSIE